MAGGTISNHVTISVTLGSAAYPNPLTITQAGLVDPGASGFYGATGVVATIAAGAILNQGTIAGALGATVSASGHSGGTGVDLVGGSLTNTGNILGGLGGYNPDAFTSIASGGFGIVVASGSVTNDGTILGGDGGNATLSNAGGVGGSGAVLSSSSLTNYGLIGGGSAVGYNTPSGPGPGGVGVDATGSSLTNGGTITGGNGAYGGHDRGGAGGAGVSLVAGSTLTNTGMIFGGSGGGADVAVYALPGAAGIGVYAASSSLTNDGTITGGAGVYITGGDLTNNGAIYNGVNAANSFLINSGAIDGFSSSYSNGGAGVNLTAGSILINKGAIAGGHGGLNTQGGLFYGDGGAGVVVTGGALTNDGTIAGGLGYAIDGFADGYGVDLSGGVVTNNGYITGHDGAGVNARNGVLFNNGTITGTYFGVTASNVTLTNNGTIDGQVAFFGGTNRLIDDPRAVFIGGAYGSSLTSALSDTLELASGASTGTIAGIGTSFADFAAITVDRHATWVVNGAVTGSGTFSLGAGSDLVVNGSVNSSGTFGMGAGTDLVLNGGVTATSGVYFGHYGISNARLGLGDPAGFAATVYDFQPGDAFDFTSITSAGSITAGVNASHELTLTSGGSLLAEIKLDPKQDFSGMGFHAAPDGATGTLVTETPLCFLAGTLIATPGGEIPVERLRVGDMVLTARGLARPVVWIGAGRVLATRGRRTAATPVLVCKGALADNVPHHDLRVTRAHALAVDGALIPVEFLVNHRSIHWDDRAQEVALYHVELETHDVLLANGAPAESYRDDGNRWLFRNANTRWANSGWANSGWDLPPHPACAPILTGGAVVDVAWLRLLKRSGPRPGVPLTDDPDLHLLVGGRRVDAAFPVGAFHVFGLAGAPDGAYVASRAGVPQELGLARDPRRLGVALRRIIIRQGSRSRTIEADDVRLARGFHAFEADEGWRWTDGDAHLPAALFAGFDGPLEVVLLCGGAARYLAQGAEQCAA